MYKYSLLFLFLANVCYPAKIVVYSEGTTSFTIEAEGYKKNYGKYFEINDVTGEKIDVKFSIAGIELNKTINISGDFLIYALSKEGDNSWNVRYRGEGYESYFFLKLNKFKMIPLEKSEEFNKIDKTQQSSHSTVDKFLKKTDDIEKGSHVNSDYYNSVLVKLEDMSTDHDKLEFIKKSFNKKRTLRSDQAIKILVTIDNEVVRLEASKMIFRFCVERNKLKEELMDIFVYDYTRRKLKSFFN